MGPGRKVRLSFPKPLRMLTFMALALPQGRRYIYKYQHLLNYQQPCLACTSCNKRLDSFTLLEHDEQVRLPALHCNEALHPADPPYSPTGTLTAHFTPQEYTYLMIRSKTCHLKLFGTRDLRHANLPQASPPASPTQGSPARPGSAAGRPSASMGISMNASANAGQATPPRAAPQPSFWATRGVNSVGAVGRISPSRAPRTQGIVRAPAWDDDNSGAAYSPVAASHRGDTDAEAEAEAHEIAVEAAEIADEREVRETLVASGSSTQSQSLIQPQPTQTGGDDEGDASPPVRTIPLPLSPIRAPYRHYTSHSVGAVVPSFEPAPSTSPARVLPTGTRYGVALGGTGSPGARTATLGGTGAGTAAGNGRIAATRPNDGRAVGRRRRDAALRALLRAGVFRGAGALCLL